MKYLYTLLVLLFYLNTALCQLGNSLVLNGITDFLEIEETDLLDYDEVLSIECWIAPNCDDGNRIIVGKEWCDGQWSYYLSVWEGKLYWGSTSVGHCASNANGFQSTNVVIPKDQYTHVAVVHDQTEVKLFINGNVVAAEYISGSFSPIYNSNQEFRIGVYKNINSSFGNYFSGLIDELRVWNIPLTEGLIQSNMNTTLSGNENGLILYLDMESTSIGSGIMLSNQANISENLTAISAGFTLETPYFTEPLSYNTNPLNFEEYYDVCDDATVYTVGNETYNSIVWNTGSMNNSILVSNSGEYSVTIETELCKFFRDTFEVTIHEQIIEEENIYLCAEDTYEFQGQLLSPNTSTEFVLPGILCDTTLTINVFEIPEEQASFLGADFTACISSVTLSSPYANTTWNGGFVGSEFIVNEEGEYVAVAFDELGCSYIDTISITFEVLFEQISVAICKDDFYPFQGDLLPPNSSYTYVLETDDGCDSTLVIHVIEAPLFESSFLGEDIISCTTSIELISPYENTIWNDVTISPSITVNNEGVYFAVGTDELGCSFSDTISVSFELIFEQISVAICKDDFYPFQGDLLPPNSSYTYVLETDDGCDSTLVIHVLEAPQFESSFLGEDIISCTNSLELISPYENTIWNNEIIAPSITVFNEGVYFAVGTDELGCSFSDSITVSFELIFEQISVAVCKDDFYPFQGDLLPPNSSYTYVLETDDGCDSTLVIQVIEAPLFESSFLGEDIISCTNSLDLISPYENTIWNNEVIAPSINVNTEGVYFAVGTDELGCTFSDSITVSFELLFEQINVTVCKDDFYPFQGDLLSPNTSSTFLLENENGCDSTLVIHVLEAPQIESSFLGENFTSCTNSAEIISPYENTIWNDEFIGSSFSVENEGVYFAVATDELGCSFTDSITVMFERNFKETTVTICKGEFYNYNGDLLPPNSSSTYVVEGINGCDTTLTINIVEAQSEEIFETQLVSICQDEIILNSPFDSTIWNDNFIGKEFLVNAEGNYFAEAVDSNGCQIKDTIQVEFLNPPFFLPNIISINSQVNNCFLPIFSIPNLSNYSLKIYDRWGNEKFADFGNDVSWCGYCKNKPVVSGVYIYVIEMDNSCESKIRKIGTLTVL